MRASILSIFALPDIETQARFIGRVAAVLFNWIRRNPDPGGRPMRGLFVLNEAADFLPRKNAASKPGLMLLARQARKYGLGLILATQNPMDLDYNATANFSTQIFGKANTPQVVAFIQKEIEQRGLPRVNPGELKTGQFYCATPSLGRPVRFQAALCLNAHPRNIQLRDEDILSRAMGSA
jgi:DNA helicase HerA-like ATPase